MVRVAKKKNNNTTNNNKKATKKASTTLKKRYVVDDFLGVRTDPVTLQRQVLVSWKNYALSASTWEPEEQLREDGFDDKLKALPFTIGQRYVFIVRFGNTRAVRSSVYGSLRSLLANFNGTEKRTVLSTPGNIHFIMRLTTSEVKEFTLAFRAWLKTFNGLGCVHAQLFGIEDKPQLSVYPPLGKYENKA